MGVKVALFVFFTFFALCSTFPLQRKQYAPCKHLVLFFHDIIYNGRNALNATSAIIAAPQGANLTKLANQFHFGNLVVFDDPVTLDNNLHSEPVGRAQGFYIYDTKNTYTACLGFNFVLNSANHQGTITVAGADPTLKKTRDISVTGGTGDFFMHRGIATIMTDAFEDSSDSMWLACCNNVIGSQFETMRTMYYENPPLPRVFPLQ